MTTEKPTTEPQFRPTDPKLREALILQRTKHQLTVKKLARLIGCTDTLLSKYTTDKLDRDPKDFEQRAWETLKAIEIRLELADELFDTTVTRGIHGRINFIRRSSDIGLLHGKAGIGKTSAALLYLERNPSSLYVPLNARTRNSRGIEGGVFNAIEHRAWKGNSSRLDFLTQRLAGSQRIIMIDNAQRMDADGRAWLFDFHDATGCPIVMLGNPEVLDKIKSNDQHASRIGICPPAFTLHDNEIAQVAARVAAQFSDLETSEELADLVAIIAQHDGHLRAVRKELVLTQVLRELQPKLADNPRAALRAAHKELVRDYDLPAD